MQAVKGVPKCTRGIPGIISMYHFFIIFYSQIDTISGYLKRNKYLIYDKEFLYLNLVVKIKSTYFQDFELNIIFGH